jgi:vitamin B12 transporter
MRTTLPRALGLASLLVSSRASAEEPALEVHVPGERARTSSRHEASSAYVLRRERLLSPGLSAADALASTPGVQVARTGGGADLATASVRGATSAELPVYLAGVRLNDDVTGTADLSTVPLALLERIEIVRGAGPLVADRAGIGGAIFLEPRLARRTSAEASLGLGSFGEASAQLAVGAASRGARSLASLRVERSTNDYAYLDDRGTLLDATDDRRLVRRNADAKSVDALGVTRVELGGRARLSLVHGAVTREQGVTGLGVIPASQTRSLLARGLVGARLELSCASRPVGDEPARACSLELVSTGLASMQRLDDPASELGLLAREVRTEGARTSHVLRFDGELVPSRLRLVASSTLELEGLLVRRDATRSVAAERLASKTSAALRGALGKHVFVSAQGALECHRTARRGDEGSGQLPLAGEGCGVFEPSGRVGLEVFPHEALGLFLTGGRAVRVPTLGELFGTSAVVRGNPELRAESALSAELGGHVRSRGVARASAELVGFARLASDQVVYRRSSLGVVRPYNVAKTRALGLEAALRAELGPTLEGPFVAASLAATLLDPRDETPNRLTTNDLLPFQATVVLTPELELSLHCARVPLCRALRPTFVRASLVGRFHYRGARVADPAGLVGLAEQRVFDLEARVHLARPALALRLAVSNVGDEPRQDVVGFPLPGRALHAGLEVSP